MHLKELREEMGYSTREMAVCLGVPASTYQCYEASRRKCPDKIIQQMFKIQEQDRLFMEQLPARVDAHIAVEYPHGIPSETRKSADDNFY